jgi:hypothetical protein
MSACSGAEVKRPKIQDKLKKIFEERMKGSDFAQQIKEARDILKIHKDLGKRMTK